MPAEIHDRWDRNFRSQRLQGSHAEADQGVSISLNTVVAIVYKPGIMGMATKLGVLDFKSDPLEVYITVFSCQAKLVMCVYVGTVSL